MLDGFIYAIRATTNQLYRIGQNGAVFNGAIYGLRDATLYKIVLGGTAGTVTTIGNTNISGSPAVGSVFFTVARFT